MKINLVLLCLFPVACTLYVSGQQPTAEAENLFPVVQNGKYGYINARGKIVIPPQFEAAYDFSEGFAVVRIAGGASFIDSNGRILMTPQRATLYDFYEGLALICKEMKGGDKCGYIDRNGQLVVDTIYDPPRGAYSAMVLRSEPASYRFSEGVASVMKNGKGGYIDHTGKYQIEAQFDRVFFFSEGLAKVEIGGKYGYIDRTGRYVINPIFIDAYDFSNGLAGASLDGRKMGYINTRGEWSITPKFESRFIGSFYEGLALGVKTGPDSRVLGGKLGKVGYIDKKGKWAIEPRLEYRDEPNDNTRRFSEGLAVFDVGVNYFNKSGKLVETMGKRGYIDASGKVVIKPRFDWARAFHNGLAFVAVGTKFGYINKKGEYVWQPSN